MELSEVADTNSLAKVDVTSKGGSTDVEPVRVVRCLLFKVAGLDNVDPDRDLDLACNAGRIEEEGRGKYRSVLSCSC